MADELEPVVPPLWVVLKRTNGHAEALGSVIAIFHTEDEAKAEAKAQADRHRETTFAWFKLAGTYTVVPTPVEQIVEESQ